MKHRIAFCFLILLSTSISAPSQAQVLMSLLFGDKLNNEDNLFGMHIDYSSNRMSGINADDTMNSFNLGLFFTHKWENNWHLNVEMLAKYQRGAGGIPFYDLGDPHLNDFYKDAEVIRKINYLSIPAAVRYAYKGKYFVELGPQLSFRTKSKDVLKVGLPQGDMTLDVDIRDEVQRFDFGFLTGIGMYIDKERVNALGIRFQGGFSDVMKNLDGSQHHSQVAVYGNLPIGRGKMKSKED